MITRNALILVIILLLALSLALVLGNIPLLALGLFAFFLSLLGLLVHTPSRLQLRRHIDRTTLWVDEKATINCELVVEGGLGPIFIYDPLPKELEIASGSNYRVFWKGRGKTQFTHSYTINCPRRGSYELPPTRWEVRHPLEFRQPLAGSGSDTVNFNVLPRLVAVRRIRNVRGLATTPYPAADLARLGIATTDFKEIRDYVPGDPVRFINWKASARQALTGNANLLVNQFELEGKKAIWLFFDSSSYMGVGTTLRSPLEHAIEAASALGYYYLNRGYYLGAHFSNNPDDMLYPDTGKGQFHRLTHKLLALSPQGQSYDLLRAVQVCRAQIFRYAPRCIIITRLDTEVGASQQVETPLPGGISGLRQNFLHGVESLVSLSTRGRRRMSVWVAAVNGYYYAAGDTPLTQMGMTLRALETRLTVRALREKGVSVLEWNPFDEEFAQTLLRQIRLEGNRE